MSRASSVRKATDYELEDSGSIPGLVLYFLDRDTQSPYICVPVVSLRKERGKIMEVATRLRPEIRLIYPRSPPNFTKRVLFHHKTIFIFYFAVCLISFQRYAMIPNASMSTNSDVLQNIALK
jgi:hypothetical protein